MDRRSDGGASRKSSRAPRHYVTMPVGAPPEAGSATVSKSMRSNRPSGTKPEQVLSRLLRKRIRTNDLPGQPDFVYPEARLAVFVNGCWWHGCPIHYSPPKTHAAFWKRKLERNLERDRFNRLELKSMGWRVHEVWEHEVKEDPGAVVRQIRLLALTSAR